MDSYDSTVSIDNGLLSLHVKWCGQYKGNVGCHLKYTFIRNTITTLSHKRKYTITVKRKYVKVREQTKI